MWYHAPNGDLINLEYVKGISRIEDQIFFEIEDYDGQHAFYFDEECQAEDEFKKIISLLNCID